MMNNYNFPVLKFYLLIAEAAIIERLGNFVVWWWWFVLFVGLCLFFFYKTKSVIEEANLHTHAAAESLPEQSGGPAPTVSVPLSATW